MRVKKRYFLMLVFSDEPIDELKTRIINFLRKEDPFLFFRSNFHFVEDLYYEGSGYKILVFYVLNRYKYEVIFILSRLGGIITLKNSGNIKKIKEELKVWTQLEM